MSALAIIKRVVTPAWAGSGCSSAKQQTQKDTEVQNTERDNWNGCCVDRL